MEIKQRKITDENTLLERAEQTENVGFFTKILENPVKYLLIFENKNRGVNDGSGWNLPFVPRIIRSWFEEHFLSSIRRKRA